MFLCVSLQFSLSCWEGVSHTICYNHFTTTSMSRVSLQLRKVKIWVNKSVWGKRYFHTCVHVCIDVKLCVCVCVYVSVTIVVSYHCCVAVIALPGKRWRFSDKAASSNSEQLETDGHYWSSLSERGGKREERGGLHGESCRKGTNWRVTTLEQCFFEQCCCFSSLKNTVTHAVKPTYSLSFQTR